MELWKDLRYSLRRLRASPWFTLAAIVTLGLGIGANTAVFTFVNAVLFRGLPFENADRIAAISSRTTEGGEIGTSYPDLLDLREGSRAFDHLAGYMNSTVNLSDEAAAPERLQGAYLTANFFRILGESAILGRDLVEEDDIPGAPPVVLLGYDLWQDRYAGDPGVLGRQVRVNSLVATVVGVMPPGMRFPNDTELWIPQANLPPASQTNNRGSRSFNGLGLLAPGVSVEQARQEFAGLGRALAENHPETNRNITPFVQSFDDAEGSGEIRIVFLSLLGAVALVLLIACGNVAGLLLARAMERSREMAVRVSMGATRFRIVRQLLVESLLLSIGGAVFGFGLAVLGIRWFDGVTQNVGKPYWMEFTLDPVVFGYMAFICLGATLAFGLAPALHISRTDVNEVLKEGSRGGTTGVRGRRWSGALIVGELVVTLVLLSGATFMIRSFLALYTLDTGVESDGLVAMELYLPLTQYPELEPRWEVYRDFLDRMAPGPQASAVALVSTLPMGGANDSGVEIAGRATEEGVARPATLVISASEHYFEVLGVELVRGRPFNAGDGGPGSLTAIVNERFVELFLADGDPIGRTLRVGFEGGPVDSAPWLTVVGVAPSIRQGELQDRLPAPVVYLPLRMSPERTTYLLSRPRGDIAAAAASIRETLALVDPDLPLFNIQTFDAFLAQERWPFRVFGTMFTVFAGIALTLSAVGLYSITAHSVIQRVREFGIRISLGALPGQIAWLALRRVLLYLAIGLPIGVLGALGVGVIMQSLLVQTSPRDPVTLAVVVLLMGSVALVASLWPARRAAAVDPVTALRAD